MEERPYHIDLSERELKLLMRAVEDRNLMNLMVRTSPGPDRPNELERLIDRLNDAEDALRLA